MVRKQVDAHHIEHASSNANDHVTISLGVASTIPSLTGPYIKLIEAADKMLYHFKQNGRNRTESIQYDPTPETVNL